MDTIVELGLDPDDRFFDHVEQSALASALSSRTRRNSLNSASVLPAPNHLPGHAIVLSHAARTHPAEETNAGIFELRPKLLCERFNILFAMCGFQTFLAVLSVAVSISVWHARVSLYFDYLQTVRQIVNSKYYNTYVW